MSAARRLKTRLSLLRGSESLAVFARAEETECARWRSSLANMFRTKLVRRFAEVLHELSDGVQVNANGGGRVVADLQIRQHALAKCGHKKAPFVVTTPQIATRNQNRVMSSLG